MFCTQCGSEIPDGSKFCKACGAKQREKDVEQFGMNMSAESVEQDSSYMETNPYAQQSPYMAANPYAQQGSYVQPNQYVQPNPYMVANPYFQANPYDPAVREKMKALRKEKRAKILKLFANMVAILGILINAVPFVGFIAIVLKRYRNDYDDFFRTYEHSIAKIVLALVAVSLAAYILLLVSKRVLYTFFYPLIATVLSILFLIVTDNYVAAYRKDNRINYGYDGVPGYIKGAKDACIWLVVASVLIFICLLLYNIKGFKWALWVSLLFGAGAVFFGALAIGQISNISDGMLFMSGNYFGYCLLVLLYALGYKDKNKPLLNGKA